MSKTIGGWFSIIFGLKLWNIHCILCQVRFSEATPVAPWRVEGGTAQRPKPSRSTERGRRTSSHKYPGCLSQYKDSNLNLRCFFWVSHFKNFQKLSTKIQQNSKEPNLRSPKSSESHWAIPRDTAPPLPPRPQYHQWCRRRLRRHAGPAAADASPDPPKRQRSRHQLGRPGECHSRRSPTWWPRTGVFLSMGDGGTIFDADS